MNSPHYRKIPKQKRAQIMVDTILEATRLTLATTGPDNVTMARIAERAGISSGSLYQYFSNLDSILAELERQHQDSIAAAIEYGVERTRHLSLNESTAALVEVTVDLHVAERETHLALGSLIPPARNTANRERMRDRIDCALVTWLAAHVQYEHLPDAPASAMIIRELVRASVHRILDSEKGTDQKAVTQEVTTMIFCYIKSLAAPV